MKRQFIGRRRIAALGIAWGLSACQMLDSTMAPPAGLGADTVVIKATDRSRISGAWANERFVLGPYAITEVDRDWDKSSRTGVGPYSRAKATSGFRYGFRAGDQPWAGKCNSRRDENAVAVSDSSRLAWVHNRVHCRCSHADQLAEITISDSSDSAQLGERQLSISRLFSNAQGVEFYEPLGFGVSGATPSGTRTDLGAVELAHPGQVWLSPELTLTEQAQLSCLFSGLLLYQPPDLME